MSGGRNRSPAPRSDLAVAPIEPVRRSTMGPRVWLLIGDKLGDNQQVELIADRLGERLGWHVERRELRFKDVYRSGKPRFRADRQHVDQPLSSALEPPWPDIVLTVGRRPSMVALWLKERSSGRTRIVIVGRPRRWLRRFDLIIAAAHHHVPSMSNVVRLGLPLIVADARAIAAARITWAPRFAQLPRPLYALFVGGPTKPHVFDPPVASDLIGRVQRCVEASGGSLWIATSPRTSRAVVDAIEAALPSGATLFRWRADSPENPYVGLLACADRFIVTGDSVSMQVEVARLGRPLAIYALPARFGVVERLRRAAARIAYGKRRATLLSRAIRATQALGLVKFPRDVAEIHALLIEQGFAVRLGDRFHEPGAGVDVDLDQIVHRIEQLAPNHGTQTHADPDWLAADV